MYTEGESELKVKTGSETQRIGEGKMENGKLRHAR